MKRIGLFLILGGIACSGMAQNTSESQEAVKKKIRELKLSEQYLYAEAVVPANVAEAQQNAKDLLAIRIAGVLTEECGMKRKEADKKWNAVVDQCESMTIQTGILYKVFTYLPKNLLLPQKEKPKVEQVSAAPEPSTVRLCAKSLPDKERRFIQKLCEQGDFKKVILFLKQQKGEQNINYGSLQSCGFLNKVYLIIVKEGQLIAILGPGSKERENLTTGAQDSIINYVGCSVIWFQVL